MMRSVLGYLLLFVLGWCYCSLMVPSFCSIYLEDCRIFFGSLIFSLCCHYKIISILARFASRLHFRNLKWYIKNENVDFIPFLQYDLSSTKKTQVLNEKRNKHLLGRVVYRFYCVVTSIIFFGSFRRELLVRWLAL